MGQAPKTSRPHHFKTQKDRPDRGVMNSPFACYVMMILKT